MVSEIELRLDRLRALYDQYFMGFEKLEPQVQRKDVDRRFQILRKENFRNTALRFRLNVAIQKYSTYQTYWQRTCRQIEEGTYKRHIAKAKARFAEREKAAGRRPDADMDIDIDVDLAELDGDDDAAFLASLHADEEDVDFEDEDSGLDTVRPVAPATSEPPRSLEPSSLRTQISRAPMSLDPHSLRTQVSQFSPQAAQAGPVSRLDPAPSTQRFGAGPHSFGPDTERQEVPSPRSSRPFTGDGRPPGAFDTPGPPGDTLVPPTAQHPRPSIRPIGAPLPPRGMAPPPRPALGAPTGRAPVPAASPRAPAPAPGQLSEDRIRQIYAQYVREKRSRGESTATTTFESVARSLRTSSEKLRGQHGGKDVDFEVAEKDGRTILKPVVK